MTDKVSNAERGRAVTPRSSQTQWTRYSEKLSAAKAEPRKPASVIPIWMVERKPAGDHGDLRSGKKGVDQNQDDLDQKLESNERHSLFLLNVQRKKRAQKSMACLEDQDRLCFF